MKIAVKHVPVEAHYSIDQIERYHISFRRIYTIIITEIPNIDFEMTLQMIFKIINDSIDFNELIFTLFVFGAYSRMIELNASNFILTQRAAAVRKVMNEVKRLIVSRQMSDALNTRNGPSTIAMHNLSLNSSIMIFKKSVIGHASTWQSSYNLLKLKKKSAIIELKNESTKFRIISMKSFYRNEFEIDENDENSISNDSKQINKNNINAIDRDIQNQINHEKKTSNHQNASNDAFRIESSSNSQSIKRNRGKSKKFSAQINFAIDSDFCFFMNHINKLIDRQLTWSTNNSNCFLIENSFQFIASRQKKINDLLKKRVFNLIDETDVSSNTRIFNARFVNEIKNENTKKTYEKSHLVIQTYNDSEKNQIFTQSSIIQRMSQWLILCIAATIENDSIKLYFRNVIQTYVQSIFNLNRDFFVKSFHEFVVAIKTSSDCILKIMKPFYEMSEASNRWFFTYHKHHIEKLVMTESTYDPCLLHCIKPFAVVGLQIDDTLILVSDHFAIKKDEVIKTANFMIKQREGFATTNPIKFNGMRIELGENETINMRHALYIESISLIKNHESSIISFRDVVKEKLTSKNQYIAHRAQNAYVASICQPEASFDLSYAAQAITVTSSDITSENKMCSV